MSVPYKNTILETVDDTYNISTPVQPIDDTYSTDGQLSEFARVDHQHPLSGTFSAKLEGNPNLLDNGQFLICQRESNLGASIASFGVSTRLFDRWYQSNNGVGTTDIAKGAFTSIATAMPKGRPIPANVPFLTVSATDAALAAGDFLVIGQFIEGQNLQHLCYKGGLVASPLNPPLPLVLSFDVYCDVTDTMVVELYNTNSGQNRSISRQFATSAHEWKNVSVWFPGDIGQSILASTGQDFLVQFFLAAGSTYTSGTLQTDWGNKVEANRAVGCTNNFPKTLNNLFSITNIQLQVGTVPTPYQVKSAAEELAACGRYLHVLKSITSAGAGSFIGLPAMVDNATFALATYQFPVIMRDGPTLTAVGAANTFRVRPAGVAHIACSTVPTLVLSENWGALLQFNVAAGLTVGQFCLCGFNANKQSQIILSAEI